MALSPTDMYYIHDIAVSRQGNGVISATTDNPYLDVSVSGTTVHIKINPNVTWESGPWYTAGRKATVRVAVAETDEYFAEYADLVVTES